MIIVTCVAPFVSGNKYSWKMINDCVKTVKERWNEHKIHSFSMFDPINIEHPSPHTHTHTLQRKNFNSELSPFQLLPVHCSVTLSADMRCTYDETQSIACSTHLFICCWDAILVIYLSKEEKERETEKALVWQNRHSHSIIQSGHPITSLFCPVCVCVCVYLACSMQRFAA